ncbi:MAG TPA: aromatic acid exporter family protein [Lachnospiraceae bacterium]|nr:aromatic acid exporter family protein [Lachnospiraceae bacterium]
MNKVRDFILLKKEAYLFDTKLYIVKAFISVLTAYAIVRNLPLVNKDMISVLFGLMMTLEPVTVTGIRSGYNQITATILGALATAIIVAVFGINIWTVAISISATLFLCLKINWREVSAVAIFTSIYMTQYAQCTENGELSMILTFQLRILALGIGVLLAILYNFLFSLFFYKRMERKRIAHILVTLSGHLKQTRIGIANRDIDIINQERQVIPRTFSSIDWLTSLIRDKDKEVKVRRKLIQKSSKEDTVAYLSVLIALRSITHLIYDTTYILAEHVRELSSEECQIALKNMDQLIAECVNMATQYESVHSDHTALSNIEKETISYQGDRILNNLKGIVDLFKRIRQIG